MGGVIVELCLRSVFSRRGDAILARCFGSIYLAHPDDLPVRCLQYEVRLGAFRALPLEMRIVWRMLAHRFNPIQRALLAFIGLAHQDHLPVGGLEIEPILLPAGPMFQMVGRCHRRLLWGPQCEERLTIVLRRIDPANECFLELICALRWAFPSAVTIPPCP